MIRINLLPQKRRVERVETASQLWLAVILVVLLVEVAGLFVFHGFKIEALNDQIRKNSEFQAQIDQAKKTIADHAVVTEKLAQLKAREDAISKLQTARTGPTAVLLELARILTPGGGPSVNPDKLSQLRRDNPLAMFNASWDSRRLWITDFVEQQRKVGLKGIARDGEDVSELARRMNMSSYFQDVKLMPAKKEKDATTGLELVMFQLEALVRY